MEVAPHYTLLTLFAPFTLVKLTHITYCQNSLAIFLCPNQNLHCLFKYAQCAN